MASDPLLVSDVSIAAWVGSPSRDRPTGGGENADVVRVKEDAPTFNRNLCESHCSGYQKDSKGNGSTHPRASREGVRNASCSHSRTAHRHFRTHALMGLSTLISETFSMKLTCQLKQDTAEPGMRSYLIRAYFRPVSFYSMPTLAERSGLRLAFSFDENEREAGCRRWFNSTNNQPAVADSDNMSRKSS